MSACQMSRRNMSSTCCTRRDLVFPTDWFFIELQIRTNVTSQHAMKCSEQISWLPCTCACLSVRLDIEPRACIILICFISRRIAILRLVNSYWSTSLCRHFGVELDARTQADEQKTQQKYAKALQEPTSVRSWMVSCYFMAQCSWTTSTDQKTGGGCMFGLFVILTMPDIMVAVLICCRRR
jgi:hypothetical protein